MTLEGEWHFYNCTMDDDEARTHVFVRTDLYEQAPSSAQTWILLLTIALHSQREDGLTEKVETEALWDIEQRLEEEFAATWSGVYVGRYTKNGRRTMVFYLCEEPDRLILANIMGNCASEYAYDAETYEDAEWDGYLNTLYPNDIAWLEIGNQPVLDRLREVGDPLTTPRHTLHWLYFDTRASRDNFLRSLNKILTQFDIVAPLEPVAKGEQFGARLEHQASVAMWDLIPVQLKLQRLAEEFGGEYDGFECMQLGDGRDES